MVCDGCGKTIDNDQMMVLRTKPYHKENCYLLAAVEWLVNKVEYLETSIEWIESIIDER